MALTLPYPSLVFVPLDKLTAEEMNQIVANYEAIANAFPVNSANIETGAVTSTELASSAVTSSKIASGAVTRSKIQWSGVTAGDIGVIAPSASVLLNIGSITSTTTRSMTYSGFLCGVARANATSGAAAAAVTIGSVNVGGVPYAVAGTAPQVSFCIPVAAGTSVKFNVSGGGNFVEVMLVQATRA